MKEEELITELYSAVNDKEKFNTILTENDISPEEALYISVKHARANTEQESITVAKSLFQFTNLDINSQSNEREWTALHKACSRMSSSEMIKLLIDKKADVNITNSFKESPLSIAASSSAVDNETLESIITASLHQDPDKKAAKLVLKKTIKEYASTSQKIDQIVAQSKFGPQVSDEQFNNANFMSTPLGLAYGNQRIAQTKLSSLKNLKEKILLFLNIENGLDVNETYAGGETLLHIAIKNKDEAFLNELLKLPNLKINIPNTQGQTALHLACTNNFFSEKLLKVLLAQENINVNIRDNNNNSPLDILIKGLNLELLKRTDELESYGDTINDMVEIGSTLVPPEAAIIHEEIQRNKAICKYSKLFLEHGLKIDDRYDERRTLLHYAVEAEDYELAKLLIERGINDKIEDDNGYTAKDYTLDENYQNEEIRYLLNPPPGKKPVSSPINSQKAENQSFTEENPQIRDSAERGQTALQRIYAEYKGNAEVLKTKYSSLLSEEILSKQSKDPYSLASIFKDI